MLHEMLYFFEKDCEYYMRGTSVLIVVDSKKKLYDVKLIDLESFEHIYQNYGVNVGPQERDDGLINGLRNLISELEQIENNKIHFL